MLSHELLESGAELEQVGTGVGWGEGPVWLPEKHCLRFSDIPNDRILEFSEITNEMTIYSMPSHYTNGRTLDLDGSVVECSHGRRAIQRDNAVHTKQTPVPEVLVTQYGAQRLNSPNDVVVKSDGTIWFTDPSYGILRPGEGNPGLEEYGDRYVFRFDRSNETIVPVVIDIEAPNGLAFSPDESLLYVTDSSIDSPTGLFNPRRPGGHAIRVYDIFDERHAKNGRIFREVSPGLPDGIRVDQFGNVWSSSLASVQVFNPNGEKLLQIPVPEKVGNLCFGGSDGHTLYIVASSSLYRIRTTTRDATDRYSQTRHDEFKR